MSSIEETTASVAQSASASAVNRKVAGSSPARGDHHFHFVILYLLKNSKKSLEPDLNQWPMDSYYFNYSPPLYQLSYRGALLL